MTKNQAEDKSLTRADIEQIAQRAVRAEAVRWLKIAGISTVLPVLSIAYYLAFTLPSAVTREAVDRFKSEVNVVESVFKPVAKASTELEQEAGRLREQIDELQMETQQLPGQLKAIRNGIDAISSNLGDLDPSAVSKAKVFVQSFAGYESADEVTQKLKLHEIFVDELRPIVSDLASWSSKLHGQLCEDTYSVERRICPDRDQGQKLKLMGIKERARRLAEPWGKVGNTSQFLPLTEAMEKAGSSKP